MIMSRLKKQSSFKKLALVTSLLLILSFLATACSSSHDQNANTGAAAPNYDYSPKEQSWDSPPEDQDPGSGLGEGGYSDSGSQVGAGAKDVMSQRKLIMDGEVSLETTYFDDSIAAMDQLINDFGGFAEVRNVVGKSQYSTNRRRATYIIRVPAERYEQALKSMGNIGTVLESDSKGTDITDTYYDTEARIKALKIQEETLLDILAKSVNLDDVITLESRISQVRYEIESLENTIRNYDRLVAFSRITVYIQEVTDRTETKPTPETLGERVSRSFNEALENFKIGCEDFIVWLAGAWIGLLIWIIIIVVILRIFKSIKRRKKNKGVQAVAAEKHRAGTKFFSKKTKEQLVEDKVSDKFSDKSSEIPSGEKTSEKSEKANIEAMEKPDDKKEDKPQK